MAGSSSSISHTGSSTRSSRFKNIDAIVHPDVAHPSELLRHLRGQRSVEAADGDGRTSTTTCPEYWEWSGEGFFPFDTSNEAYKLGVNYLIYGLTH